MRPPHLRPTPLLAAALLVAASAAAQERTSASYEDWVLQCETQPGPPARKVCEIMQTTQMQGRNVPVSRVSVAHPEKGQPVKLTAQVPVSIQLAGNIRLQVSDADPGLTVPFNTCWPAGCFADFDLKDDAIRKFRTATENGKLTYKSSAGQPVTLPVSFKGFGRAFDALGKE
jgi:invasion protein IalB